MQHLLRGSKAPSDLMGERFDWHLEGTLSHSLAIMTLQTKQSQQTAEIGQKRD